MAGLVFSRRLHWFRCLQWLLALGLSLLLLVGPLSAAAWAESSPQQQLQQLDRSIQRALEQLATAQLTEAADSFGEFRQGWGPIEAGIKAVSRSAYRDIEDAMGEVRIALATQPPEAAQVQQALEHLHQLNLGFIQGQDPEPTAHTSPDAVSISSLLQHLEQAQSNLSQHNLTSAQTAIAHFRRDWPEVEGTVAAKSQTAYSTIENLMALAAGQLNSQPPQVDAVQTTLTTLTQTLSPFAESTLRYTLFDSTVILLREGLEALLVIVALLAFLVRSGNGEQSRWIWVGAGVGLLASVAVALVIRLVFANLSLGSNRELLEGLTGLIAAAMLFYVSYWLHNKSSLSAWQGYIRQQTTLALAKNSVASLALLSGLAVFREGAETVLFYIGIAPAISTQDLLGGLALGAGLLAVIATLMLGFGLKIPLQPFFRVTSLLIYYLGFKFVGNGIHALQVSGWFPAHPAGFLPDWGHFGVYPTWETALPQLLLLVGAIAVVVYTRSRPTGEKTVEQAKG